MLRLEHFLLTISSDDRSWFDSLRETLVRNGNVVLNYGIGMLAASVARLDPWNEQNVGFMLARNRSPFIPVLPFIEEFVDSDLIINDELAAYLELKRHVARQELRLTIRALYNDYWPNAATNLNTLLADVVQHVRKAGHETSEVEQASPDGARANALNQFSSLRAPSADDEDRILASSALTDTGLRQALIRLRKKRRLRLPVAEKVGEYKSLIDANLAASREGWLEPTELGNRVAEKSRWMQWCAVEALRTCGVPNDAIRVPLDTEPDDIDLAFFDDGLVVCEMTDGQFQEGDAAKFSLRLRQLQSVSEAIIVASHASPQAKSYLNEFVGMRASSPLVLTFLNNPEGIGRALQAHLIARRLRLFRSAIYENGPARSLNLDFILESRLVIPEQTMRGLTHEQQAAVLTEVIEGATRGMSPEDRRSYIDQLRKR